MPNLAQNMMREAPVAIDGCAQELMQEIVQRLRSMIGAQIRSGFGCKDKGEQENGEPRLNKDRPAYKGSRVGIG